MSVELILVLGFVCVVAALAALLVVRARASVGDRVELLARGLGYTTELAASL